MFFFFFAFEILKLIKYNLIGINYNIQNITMTKFLCNKNENKCMLKKSKTVKVKNFCICFLSVVLNYFSVMEA